MFYGYLLSAWELGPSLSSSHPCLKSTMDPPLALSWLLWPLPTLPPSWLPSTLTGTTWFSSPSSPSQHAKADNVIFPHSNHMMAQELDRKSQGQQQQQHLTCLLKAYANTQKPFGQNSSKGTCQYLGQLEAVGQLTTKCYLMITGLTQWKHSNYPWNTRWGTGTKCSHKSENHFLVSTDLNTMLKWTGAEVYAEVNWCRRLFRSI